MFYASAVNCYFAGNDSTIMFLRPRPAIASDTPEGTAIAFAEPVAVMQMSVQTLKDLFLTIKVQIEAYEKDFGEIETMFSRTCGKQK